MGCSAPELLARRSSHYCGVDGEITGSVAPAAETNIGATVNKFQEQQQTRAAERHLF
jgi:hypothetical protein